jgi:Flp pilus assembly protein TadG
MMRAWRSLHGDERGVSAIEFGMILPILATLTLGIIDLSSALSQHFTLQQAVNRSFEMVQANRLGTDRMGGTPSYAFMKDEVAAAAGIPLSSVTLRQWRECDGVAKTPFEGNCPDRPATAATGGKTTPADTARYLELTAKKTFKGSLYWKTVDLEAKSAVRVQ